MGTGSTCNAGDAGLIPGLGRSLEESMATHSSILAWRIPWTEKSGRLQSMGLQESDMTEHTHRHAHACTHTQCLLQSVWFREE